MPKQTRTKCRTESISTDDLLLQPWFLGKKLASSIRSMMPEIFSHKMTFYFEDWGCMVCRAKNRRYGSNGMCHICTTRIQKRICGCLKKRALKTPAEVRSQNSTVQEIDRVQIATNLLSDIARGDWSRNRISLRTSVRRVKGFNAPGMRR